MRVWLKQHWHFPLPQLIEHQEWKDEQVGRQDLLRSVPWTPETDPGGGDCGARLDVESTNPFIPSAYRALDSQTLLRRPAALVIYCRRPQDQLQVLGLWITSSCTLKVVTA